MHLKNKPVKDSPADPLTEELRHTEASYHKMLDERFCIERRGKIFYRVAAVLVFIVSAWLSTFSLLEWVDYIATSFSSNNAIAALDFMLRVFWFIGTIGLLLVVIQSGVIVIEGKK